MTDYILPLDDFENEDSNNKIIQILKLLTKKKENILQK